MFGIDKYEIVWSYTPVAYAYADPGALYCMMNGIAYGYGVQIAEGSDIAKVGIGMPKIDQLDYKTDDYLCYRPLVSDDNLDRVLNGGSKSAYRLNDRVVIAIEDVIQPDEYEPGDQNYAFELVNANEYNEFEISNWYLIPLDDEDNQVLELNSMTRINTGVEAGYNLKYWFTYEDLFAEDQTQIALSTFKAYLNTAIQYNFEDCKIVFNNSSTEPIFYSFASRGKLHGLGDLKKGAAVQIIHTEDIEKIYNLKQSCLDEANGDEQRFNERYNWFLNNNIHPCWYCTLAENNKNTYTDNRKYAFYYYDSWDEYDDYVLIPLKNGQEDLRIY
jgi:hypothetical protein